jgi:hypothetical protein
VPKIVKIKEQFQRDLGVFQQAKILFFFYECLMTALVRNEGKRMTGGRNK